MIDDRLSMVVDRLSSHDWSSELAELAFPSVMEVSSTNDHRPSTIDQRPTIFRLDSPPLAAYFPPPPILVLGGRDRSQAMQQYSVTELTAPLQLWEEPRE